MQRPKTRAECADVPRPCPFVSCKYHLYLDVSPRTGHIKYNHPNIHPDLMCDSCALDVADRGGVVLDDIAKAFSVTREAARQMQDTTLVKIGRLRDRAEFADFFSHFQK